MREVLGESEATGQDQTLGESVGLQEDVASLETTRKENGTDGRKDSMIELEPKLCLEIRVTKRHEL